MKPFRYTTLLVFVLLLCAQGAYAQDNRDQDEEITAAQTGSPGPEKPAPASIWEKLQLSAGGFLEFFPIKYADNSQATQGTDFFSSYPLIYGLAVGGNYIFAQKSDMFSLAANANVHLGFSYVSNGGAIFNLQTPVFLMGRVGANCTRYNTNKIGAGIGVGFNFNYLLLPYGYNTASGVAIHEGTISAPYIAPAAMAEINTKFGRQAMTIRFHINLLPIKQTHEDLKQQRYPITLGNFGFGFIYYFK